MDTNVAVRLHSEEWYAGYARCRDKVAAWLDAEAARCCERADASRGIIAGDRMADAQRPGSRPI
jgi:hypothetical protein